MKSLKYRIMNLSLFNKLILSYLFIMALPTILFYRFYYHQELDKVQSAYQYIMNARLQQIRTNAENRIGQMLSTSVSIRSNRYLVNYLRNYHEDPDSYFLEMIGNLGNLITSVNTLNPDIYSMRIYCLDESIPRYKNIIYSVRFLEEKPVFRHLRRLGFEDFYWEEMHRFTEIDFLKSGVVINPVPDEEVLTLYRKIYSSDVSTVLGYLELNIEKDALFGVAATADDQSFTIFTDRNRRQTLLGKNEGGTPVVIPDDFFVKQESSSVHYMNNEKYIVQSAGLESLDAGLVMAYPYSLIRSEIGTRRIALLIIIIISFAALVLVTSFVSHIIFRRMEILIEHMKEVQQGNLDVKIDIDYMDEVGQIKKAFNIMVDRINTLINTVYKAQLMEKEATLSYLQAQMNPHFLFNALEAIRMTAELQKDYEVSDALFSMSRILHARVRPNAFTPLTEELHVIQSFVHIENIRHDNRIVFEVALDPALMEIKIPALILQPLVENSIVHGFMRKRSACRVVLSGRFESPDRICLEVRDNGSGFPETVITAINEFDGKNIIAEERVAGRQGIGLLNVHERIRLYYGDGFGLRLHNNHEGAAVVITLSPEPANLEMPAHDAE